MPNVRFVHYPPRIVEAKLMSWEPGVPAIWSLPTRPMTPMKFKAAIKILSDEDQNKLTRALETYHTVRALLF